MAEPIPPNKQLSELAYRSPVITGRALTPNLEQLEDSNLAGELFGPDAIMAMAGPSSPDGWPVSPSHTCGAYSNGTVLTLRQTSLTAARIITPDWRSDETRQGCPACYHRRVLRYCNQIATEQESGLLWELKVDEGEYKRQAATWRGRRRNAQTETKKIQRAYITGQINYSDADEAIAAAAKKGDVRYCPFPQAHNQYIIIHNQEKDGGELLTCGRAELYERVKAIANTPENKRLTPSEGWGGCYQGAKGDGRIRQERKATGAKDETGPCVQLWTKRGLPEVAKPFNEQLKPKQKSFKVDMNPFDAYHLLSGFELYERHTNRLGVTALLEMFAPLPDENITFKDKENQDNTFVLKRDILAGESGQGGNKNGFSSSDTPLFPKALQHQAVAYSPGGRHVAF